jgi:nucleoside-triphosphatase THEP1
MIANIPDFKTIIRNPVSVIYQIISQANFRLAEIKNSLSQKVFIISGAVGSGKTTLLQKTIETLKENNISVGGIYSPRILADERTIGYDVVDIMTENREMLLREAEGAGLQKIGRYSIFPAGLQNGKNALLSTKNSNNKIVVIDEVGHLELDDQGWANSITALINASDSHLLLAVRDTFVEKVIHKWNFKEYFVYKVSEKDYLTISNLIMEQIG